MSIIYLFTYYFLAIIASTRYDTSIDITKQIMLSFLLPFLKRFNGRKGNTSLFAPVNLEETASLK
jgi:hypothetical protein